MQCNNEREECTRLPPAALRDMRHCMEDQMQHQGTRQN
jgi:hypothetical protein